MNEGLVTIVLPIYNVAAYLDRCVESVVNQTYKNLEIILVDDGSPDECPAMCDAWAQKDPRVKVVHKENAGLGFARNTGIENATGEYICFFDSDDYVEPTLVETCYHMAQKEKADIVCFGHDSVSSNGEILAVQIPSPPQLTYEGETIRTKLIPRLVSYDAATGEDWQLMLSAWSSMISMRVIQQSGWRFVSEREIISEDYYSMLDLYQYVSKAAFIRQVLYHYVVNNSSLSRVYRKDRYERLKHWAVSMEALALRMECEIEAEIDTCFCGMVIGVMKQLIASREKIADKRKNLSEIIKDDYLQEILRKRDYSRENLAKKMLFWGMKQKFVTMCYVLCIIRNMKG